MQSDQDDDQAGIKTGASTALKTEKAGCGIRFDQSVLSEDASFDFSKAADLKAIVCDDADNNKRK